MVWIDQPITTGFSRGTKIVNNETDVTTDFMGFWKNFIDTFSMKGYEIYILGESYAGQYIPYIASGMLDAKDHDYFNVKGVQINDPLINVDDVMIVSKFSYTARV
jgi:carboxypeptidase D